MVHVGSPETAGHMASVHTANEIGIHRAIIVHGLAGASLSEVLRRIDLPISEGTRGSVGDLERVLWIDFPSFHRGAHWFERELATTHLAIQEGARLPADFVPAGVVISSMLQVITAQKKFPLIPKAYEKTMNNFAPDPRFALPPQYIQDWLPDFLLRDRPHPPNAPARTDTIRMLAAVVSEIKAPPSPPS